MIQNGIRSTMLAATAITGLTVFAAVPANAAPDALHPNEEGYRVWGRAMEPVIRSFPGEDQAE